MGMDSFSFKESDRFDIVDAFSVHIKLTMLLLLAYYIKQKSGKTLASKELYIASLRRSQGFPKEGSRYVFNKNLKPNQPFQL